MPKLPTARDPSILDVENLMRPESASLMARQPAIIAHVEKRQIVEGIIPTYYTVDGPTSGTVVGIVLGSVLGFLLLIWLFYSIANINNTPGNNAIAGVEEEIVVRRPRKSHSGHSRRSTRTEVREYSRSPRREHIIVEERRQPRPPRPRSIVVEERRSRSRVPGDDIVEVIEEHEDYRERRGSRRY